VAKVRSVRIYDALLGGSGSRAADRDVAAELLRLVPGAVMAAYQNRQFIRSAIEFIADQGGGVTQFIDIGAGLLGPGNVHQVAAQCTLSPKVLCVDNDPLVLSRVEAQFGEHPTTKVIGHDLRDPAGLLRNPGLRGLIDLGQPVAVVLGAVLHYIQDDADPWRIVDVLTGAMAPGSYLILSHATGDYLPTATVGAVRELYSRAGSPVYPRTRTAIARFLNGLDIVPPGLVNGAAWRHGPGPVTDPRRALFYAAVGRKP
jgi:hypothetical protein